jgi:hypothetical protein
MRLIKQAAIPFAARAASVYYGFKHGSQMKDAIWRLANA